MLLTGIMANTETMKADEIIGKALERAVGEWLEGSEMKEPGKLN